MEDAQGETKEEGTPVVSRLRTCLPGVRHRLPRAAGPRARPAGRRTKHQDRARGRRRAPGGPAEDEARQEQGKPKSSDVERRIREARLSADPWVEIERIRQEQGYPDGWSEQIAGFYGITAP